MKMQLEGKIYVYAFYNIFRDLLSFNADNLSLAAS